MTPWLRTTLWFGFWATLLVSLVVGAFVAWLLSEVVPPGTVITIDDERFVLPAFTHFGHWLTAVIGVMLAALVIVIALPEELFFRAFVQGRLADAYPPRWRLFGARVGGAWLVTAALFVALYIGVVVTSLPGATILTLTGGFVFGVVAGVLFSLIGATVGAVLIFLAARAGFGRDAAGNGRR